MEIGVQFFTLRDFCKTTEEFAESLKKVADMGYRTVQISGTCEYEAEWLAEQLKANGLRCVLTHYNMDKLRDETEEDFRFHQVFGCKYLGIGCMPGFLKDPEDYTRFVKNFKAAGKQIGELGGKMMYHNHQMEFMRAADGKRYIEKLAEDFTPDELGFTLDTYWVQYGGADPAQWLEKLSGRVPCIHLKDMACVDQQPAMAPIGEGNINFDRVFLAAEKAGTEYMLVEQDNCNGEDPFDCLKRSYAYLTAQGFK